MTATAMRRSPKGCTAGSNTFDRLLDPLGRFFAPTRLRQDGNAEPVSDVGRFDTVLKISFEDAAIFGQSLGFINDDTKFAVGERSGTPVFDLETGAAKRLQVPGRAKRIRPVRRSRASRYRRLRARLDLGSYDV